MQAAVAGAVEFDYQLKGESAESLRFMAVIDEQFLNTPWHGSC